MRNRSFLVLLLSALAFLVSLPGVSRAELADDETHIFGHVQSQGRPLSFAAVTVKGTSLGTTTDETGHYILHNVPVGEIEVVVSSVGYRTTSKRVTVSVGVPLEVDFEVAVDVLNIDQVVVTGDRSALGRREASTVISTVSPRLLQLNNASTISEGLPFISGVRMENNCQNCGFNQVRLNGLEGPYSQILVDGQPIFSGLLAVYGMEMIPSNMISRIEVQRGGGSTLYGSSAVAGTVNIILQDPAYNAYSVGFNTGFTGAGVNYGRDYMDPEGKKQTFKENAGAAGVRPDYNVNFNASAVSSNNRTGLTVYGDFRERMPFDSQGDGYSEIPQLRNISVGTRLFQKLGRRGNLSMNYIHISENRRGGDMDMRGPEHEADVAEALRHHVNVASASYTQMLRESDLFQVNASLQHVKRKSYYGGGFDLTAYGHTQDLAFNLGTQYTANFDFGGRLIGGIDFQGESLQDTKMGFRMVGDSATLVKLGDQLKTKPAEEVEIDFPVEAPADIANQFTSTVGAYAQYTHNFGIASITAGVRGDYYTVRDRLNKSADFKGFVPVPRASVLIHIIPEVQMRANYSMGYRKPQVYNEDLHVDLAEDRSGGGVRQVRYMNSPSLKSEISHSGMLSFDYNQSFDNLALGFLVEGFYTRLNNAFITAVNEDMTSADPNRTKWMERSNNPHGAHTYGINSELNIAPLRTLAFRAGLTWHRAEYLAIEDGENNNRKEFMRSPNTYGYIMADWKIWGGLSLAATVNVTGRMLVPYGGSQNLTDAEKAVVKQFPEGDVLPVRTSPIFADLGAKLAYDFDIRSATLQLYAGVKNALNSWQKDWDLGPDRDSAYAYGPSLPRTVYVGVRLGNIF